MMHTCPKCGFPCGCDDEELYGDCCHDCDSWKADPPERLDWNNQPIPFNDVED